MRKTSKLLASLLVVCMLVACIPMGTLFASAETMSAEPSKNSTPAANELLYNPVAVKVQDSNVLTGNASNLSFAPTAFGIYKAAWYFDSAKTSTKYDNTAAPYSSSFSSADTVTWEFTYNVDEHLSLNPSNDLKDMLIYFRGNGGTAGTDTIYLLVRSNTTRLISGNDPGALKGTYFAAGSSHTIKFVSNSTKCSIYIDGVALVENYVFAEKHPNMATNTVPCFSIGFRNSKVSISNMKVYGPKAGVTAPTDANNLVLTNGKWTANYTNNVYPFTAEGNNFYLNTSVAGQVAGGLTAYTSAFEAAPFNANVLSNTKSYVISANTARANATNTNPNDGKPVVARVYYYFGTYKGTDFMIYFDKNGYHWCKEGYKTYTQNDLLKNVALNEYARITAYVTPFGIDIYVNGEFLTSMAIEDPSLFVPRFTFRSAGTEVWFKDVAIWENTANGDEYYDVLSAQYNYYEANGVRSEYADASKVAALKTALDAYTAGSANTALTAYVTTFAGANITAVNNYVADGTFAPTCSTVAAYKKGYFSHIVDANVAPTSYYTHYDLNLFSANNNPIVAGKDYVLEFDANISDYMVGTSTQVRFGFVLGTNTANNKQIRMIYQDNSILFTDSADAWQTITKNTPFNAKNGGKVHVKIVFSDSKITMIATSSNGTTNVTANLVDYGFDLSKVTLKPAITIRTAKMELSNLYIGESVEASKDALSSTVTEYTGKDTNGFTAETVKAFTDALAAANTIVANYNKYSNAEINAAATAIVAAFGNLEKETVKVPVGDLEIEIAPDEDLPVNERVDTKFVLGWKNPDGTKYEGKTYVEGLVAEFVETKMMTVKYQVGKSGDAIRYIASVDETERYSAVGWLFSLTNDNPEKGGANVVEKTSSKVYSSLIANGVEKTTAEIYGGVDYSQYIYVFEITDIPESAADTTIYVRPYVEMNDGTIVYGDVAQRALNQLKTK